MKIKTYWKSIFVTLLVAMGMTACHDDESVENPKLVENGRIVENGQTLSPGESIHLAGNGYLEGDEVMLDFYWKTGLPSFPEGYSRSNRAQIQETAPNAITIRLPYRKPESRVEVTLWRQGHTMPIGEVYMKDGTTPKEPRLYGINNNLNSKGDFTDAAKITRCESDSYDLRLWTLEVHPDFHSVVPCWQSYGLCGLSKTDGNQCPFFFDFCTSEWKQLSDIPTLALFGTTGGAMALQTDGKNCCLRNISASLERCDYATIATRSAPVPQTKGFPLPDNLTAEQFGEYPGAFTGKDFVLLSADKGNGKWQPVIFSIETGFHVLDDIAADGLIPFSFIGKDKKWRFGYVVARGNAVNGTELYISGDNASTLFTEPYAVFPDRAVSVSANHDKPGTVTVYFLTSQGGGTMYNFLYDTKEWQQMDNALGQTFDEMVWTN